MSRIRKISNVRLNKPKLFSIIAVAVATAMVLGGLGTLYSHGNNAEMRASIATPSGTASVAPNFFVKDTLIIANDSLIPGNYVQIDTSTTPYQAAYDSSNGNIYVTNTNGNNVSVINGTTNSVAATLNVEAEPEGVAYNPFNGNIYVVDDANGYLSVINGTTNRVTENITLNTLAQGVACNPSNGNIYVTDYGSNNVSVINGTTNSVTSTINVGLRPQGVAYNPSNGYMYVTNFNSNNVSVINGATNSVTSTINVGRGPQGVAYNPSNGYVYVVNSGSNNVSVINGATNAVTANINVGIYPAGIAYNPSNGYMYVTNYQSNSISILSYNYSYKTTFTETGLPSNTPWYVNITESQSYQSTTSTITAYLTNGSYTYSVGTVNKTYNASSGSFTVDGAVVSNSVNFNPLNYTVLFKESGLPTGTSWTVTFNGVAESSTGTSITFSVQNGTYSYTVNNLTKYYTADYAGSLNVNGAAASRTVTFAHYSYINITMNPGNATLYINGVKELGSSEGILNITETAGTYNITVDETGYKTFYDNFTLAAGHTQDVNATLRKLVSPASDNMYIIGGAVVVVVGAIGFVSVASLKRRKRE